MQNGSSIIRRMDDRNSEAHFEDLLAQLPTGATLFIERSHLAHITGLTGRDWNSGQAMLRKRISAN